MGKRAPSINTRTRAHTHTRLKLQDLQLFLVVLWFPLLFFFADWWGSSQAVLHLRVRRLNMKQTLTVCISGVPAMCRGDSPTIWKFHFRIPPELAKSIGRYEPTHPGAFRCGRPRLCGGAEPCLSGGGGLARRPAARPNSYKPSPIPQIYQIIVEVRSVFARKLLTF